MKCTIKLYHLKKLAYFYEHSRIPIFDDPQAIIEDLYKWQKDLSVWETGTDDNEERTGHCPVYIWSMEKSENGYCIVLWNSIPTNQANQKVMSIPKNSSTGSMKYSESNIDKDHIPGYPTYFWISPENRLACTLHFKHGRSNLLALSRMIQYFMNLHASYIIKKPVDDIEKDNNDDKKVTGYIFDGKRIEGDDIKGKIDLCLVKQVAQIEDIKRNCADITRVYRKSTLNISHVNDQTSFDHIFGARGWNLKLKPQRFDKTINYVTELRISPTEEELAAMFNDMWFEISQKPDTTFCNVGVDLKQESGTTWLAKSAAEKIIDLPIHSDKMGIFHPDVLALQVNEQNNEFTKILETHLKREKNDKAMKKELRKESQKTDTPDEKPNNITLNTGNEPEH